MASGIMDRVFAGFRAQPVDPKKALGAGSAVVYNGYLATTEKNAKLQGLSKYETYSNILTNTTIVASGIRYFLNLIGKADWKVQPADDSSAAKEAAEFLEEVMYDMETQWSRIVKRSAMYRFYGFSIQEWTAKVREDGRIGFKDIESRAQSTIERWDIDETGTLTGVIQRAPQNQREIYLPRQKIVYMVDDSLNDSPEGMGLLRHVVDPSARLARYEVLEGFGFEADLRGVPVGRAPLAKINQMVRDNIITQDEANKMIQPIKNFIENHIKNPKLGMMLDSLTYQSQDEAASPSAIRQWDIDVLNVDTSSQEAVAQSIERINREMARVLNVEGLLLGSDSKGSFALSKDKTNALYLVVDGTLTDLAQCYQKDIVEPLWALNGLPKELMPELKTEALQFRDIEQVTAALRDLATAGAVMAPDDPAINEVRDMLGISDAPDQDLDASLTPDENMPESDPEDMNEEDDAPNGG